MENVQACEQGDDDPWPDHVTVVATVGDAGGLEVEVVDSTDPWGGRERGADVDGQAGHTDAHAFVFCDRNSFEQSPCADVLVSTLVTSSDTPEDARIEAQLFGFGSNPRLERYQWKLVLVDTEASYGSTSADAFVHCGKETWGNENPCPNAGSGHAGAHSAHADQAARFDGGPGDGYLTVCLDGDVADGACQTVPFPSP